jgi:type I restriction enzyme M protein
VNQAKGFGDKVAFIWSVADLLRGDFKAHEYGQVILPFVVLRRLECALESTKPAVLAKAAQLTGKFDNVEPLLLHEARERFYNTSPLDLTSILQDPPHVAANLRTYLAGFSPGAQEVLDRYGFEEKVVRLDKAGLLYQVIGKFAEIDLSVTAVSNDTMGYIFEELLRRFSEMSNETAGEHFTPREVIRLMVNVLLAPDSKVLSGQKPIRTIYDPACGTGGMLTVAQEHLISMNPNAELVAYGQELNPETWAICRSDLMIKGQDPALIALGNSLIVGGDERPGDGHPGEHFDYLLANPPFGVDWNKYADDVREEYSKLGFDGRYGPGLPRVSDGSMLFLLHMISKFKPVADDPKTPDIIEGGSRMGIVLSGSPLFAGSAGGGESEIRRFILENDLLEGIIALPDTMFYNTGINTYVWILTNRKTSDRCGKVVLLDAREMFTKMPRSLGAKRKTISETQIDEVTQLYVDALLLDSDDSRVKVLEREDFGFQRITVEQPLRRHWAIDGAAIDAIRHDKAWTSWGIPPKGIDDPATYLHDIESVQLRFLEILESMKDTVEETETGLRRRLIAAINDADLSIVEKVLKLVVSSAAQTDPGAPIITDRKGHPLPDPEQRDQENVPLRADFLNLDEDEQKAALIADADDYLQTEILPWSPGAWVDYSKTKLGFEIPFTRHFYLYTPPRDVAEIDIELDNIEVQIRSLMDGLVR